MTDLQNSRSVDSEELKKSPTLSRQCRTHDNCCQLHWITKPFALGHNSYHIEAVSLSLQCWKTWLDLPPLADLKKKTTTPHLHTRWLGWGGVGGGADPCRNPIWQFSGPPAKQRQMTPQKSDDHKTTNTVDRSARRNTRCFDKTPRTVVDWKNLEDSTVCADTVEIFWSSPASSN